MNDLTVKNYLIFNKIFLTGLSMAVFGKNGFIRKQEIAFAKKMLVIKYEKSGSALPDEKVLTAYAEKIVEDAHVIAKRSGNNILEILKERLKEIQNKKSI